MSKNTLPPYEPLDDALRSLKQEIRPDDQLKSATAELPATIPPHVHVRQTAKAILVYAVCITLFLGAILLLPRLFNTQSPVGTQSPSETNRSATTIVSTTPSPETTPSSPSHTLFPPVNLTPVTSTVPTPETEPVDKREYCIRIFDEKLAEVGKSVTVSRELTAEELARVYEFAHSPDAMLVLASAYEPFYRPEDISLYELLYASNSRDEFPGNPYQNDGSMMTATRIRQVVKRYAGIDVTQEMWDRLIADGAEYFPQHDAYGFPHTDASGFYAGKEMFGYLTEDGKWLVHLYEFDLDGAHMVVLLSETENGFFIEAGQRINQHLIPESEKPVDERKVRLTQFSNEYKQNTGTPLTQIRKLNTNELARVAEFVDRSDVQMIFATMIYKFYKPEDIKLKEIINANPHQFPDNPYGNDSSMMTKAQLEQIVRDYLGIEITEAMLDKMLADGVEYLPALDAYCVRYGSFAAFEAEEEMMGYVIKGGKWLVHLTDAAQAPGHPVIALLTPTEDGFLIEAGDYLQ